MLAESAGADRVELCADAASGGITPSAGVIQCASERLRIPLFVMIRPRAGGFVYSEAALTAMDRDIAVCRELKVDGVVLGLLDVNNCIDKERTQAMVEAARPMEVTFHRAFDLAGDAMQALEDVIASGCSRLLTSGQNSTAEEGAPLIASLTEQAHGRIVIMPGSGVRAANLAQLARQTGATEFHSSARVRKNSAVSESFGRDSTAIRLGFGESVGVDEGEVRALRIAADSLSL